MSAVLNGPTRVRFLVKESEDPLDRDGPNVIRNLSRRRKSVSSVYVYDSAGTDLFERQCATEEYYLRRAETRLLREHAQAIVDCCGAIPVVELGAGTGEKTCLLLAEYADRDWTCDYYPIDVDTATLAAAAERLTEEFPRLTVHAVGTTYAQGLRALAGVVQHRLVLFLGSSLGNMELSEMDELLSDLFRYGTSGEYLLLAACRT